MKHFATVAVLASAIPTIWSLTINTPTSVVQCQPQLLTWSDGTAPFYLTVIPGGQASAAPLKSFDPQNGNSMTWIVDIAGGTSVTIALKDGTGAMAYTDQVNIQTSSDSSCLNGGSNSGNTGGGITTKAADAASSMSSGSAAPSSANHAATAGSSQVSAITRTNSVGGQTTQVTQSVVRAASSSNAATSAATTGNAGSTSGAQSKYSVGGYLVAGALGLVGAAFF
ncbi:hypothetical protein D9613_007753 [Agrocybe pediades]|uniref:Uncharacterized protein n=1 Tax=Agrocybe pediades TaxID=84607 RepID=A0A8H4QNK6_9AGAR|nr:hypothetical protein D9613_007753 [Agrocybe pediades]